MHVIKGTNVYHIWTVLCQSAEIDPGTNDLTINKTIDGLTLGFEDVNKLQQFTTAAKEKPAVAPIQSELVMLWKKEDRNKGASFDVRVVYTDPDGKELQTMDFPLTMEDGTFRHRHRLNIPALIISGSGEYTFVISAKGHKEKEYESVAEIPLDINFKLEQ